MEEKELHNKVPLTYFYPLWLVGMVLFVYLCAPFFSKQSGMYLPDLLASPTQFKKGLANTRKFNSDTLSNEALVFVTVNKKKLLTKFVTYISDEALREKERTDTSFSRDENSFLIIGRQKKNKKQKTKNDFVIKSAPKI